MTDSRVLEIEARQLENRRLELEVERLAIDNQHLRASPVQRRVLAFEGLPTTGQVNVNVDGAEDSGQGASS